MKLKIILYLLFTFFCAAILALAIRGLSGNPTPNQLGSVTWRDDGPFELSPERGRFALLYSIVENHSFFFDIPIAKFATPDLGYANGKYVSLFAPTVSFITAPGYIVGKMLGASQVGTFAVVSLFALINVLLLLAIANRLGANPIAAAIGSLTFIFASPAFAYGVTLYQHHISTFLILLSIYTLLRWKNIWSLGLIWFLFVASIPVDYPNLILMFPIAIYALGRMIIVKKEETKTTLNIKLLGFLTFLTMILPLSFFLWFNQASYGNPFQLSGTVKSVEVIDENGMPSTAEKERINIIGKLSKNEEDSGKKKTATGFFKTRALLNGFYIHFISPDRGIIWYTPVVLLGILGMWFMYKKNPSILALLAGIVGANVLLYSMWGDPWGGWAFGSRYLIPSYAIMALFIAIALSQFRRNILFLVIFVVVMVYSVFINTLGAVTSNLIPPQVEVTALEQISGRQEKYTFARDFDFLVSNHSKSFIWQTYANNYVSAVEYYYILAGVIIIVMTSLVIILYFFRNKYD